MNSLSVSPAPDAARPIPADASERGRLPLPALAFAIGLLTCLWAGYVFGPFGEDVYDYQALARNVVAGHGLSLAAGPPYPPSAARVPVYPLFLAAVYATVGESREALLVVQSVVLALGWAALTALAGLFFDRRVALFVALSSSLNAYLCRWAGAVLTEALYMALLVLCVYLFAKGLTTSRLRWFVLCGLVWAAATLCRSVTVALMPFMLLTVYLFHPKVERPTVNAAALALAGLAAMSPWVVRNWIAFGDFIPLQVRVAGYNFWLTTLPVEDQPLSGWEGVEAKFDAKYPEFRAIKSARDTAELKAAEALLVEAALARIKEDPVRYLAMRVRTYPHLWVHSGKLWYTDISFRQALSSGNVWVLAVKVVCMLVFSLLPLALAAAGAFMLRHRWRTMLPLLIVPVWIGLFHAPMWIEERYGMPAVPFFLVLGMYAIVGRSGSLLGPGMAPKAEGGAR